MIATPQTLVVVLVILLGAIVYLWLTRHIRPGTAYALIAFLVAVLIMLALSMR